MTKSELAQKLRIVEERLDMIEIEGCNIGTVLSKYHENIFNNNVQCPGFLDFIKILMMQWAKGLLIPKPNVQVLKNKLLLSKIATRDHLNALIDPIKNHFNNRAVIYTPESKNELIPYDFPKRFTPAGIYRISKAIFHRFDEIENTYKHVGLNPNGWQLALVLLLQVNSFRNWRYAFKENRPIMIVVDFDRDNRNSPMLLAARKYDIKTVTLVHGTINPYFGFTPLVANEIWCWGNFQKSQLIAQGISEIKINILGSPIAQKFNKFYKSNKKSNVKIIGIGLNPMGDEYNNKFLRYLLGNQFDNIKWLVKLHPSMVKSNWMIEFENEKVAIYESTNLSKVDFFSAVDVLIIGNSGIGFEAVVNEVPIWVYSPNNEGFFHDKVMIFHGNCPDITEAYNLNRHLNSLISQSNYLYSLLEKEKSFVLGEFYSFVGKESTNKMIDTIEKRIKNVI